MGASTKTGKRNLTPQQELFCKLYASEKEFFGNGVESYAEAYGWDLTEKGAYKNCASNASRLLTNADILERIDELLEVVLNDQIADKTLAFWMVQKASPQASVAAVKEYNALRGRVVKKLEGKLLVDVPESLVRFMGNDSRDEDEG